MRVWFVLGALVATSAAAGEAPEGVERSTALATGLKQALEARLTQPAYENTRVGIHIVSMDGALTLYERDADSGYIPASATKVLPAGVSLLELGGDFRFETPLLTNGELDADGRLQGDVFLVGRGDPGLKVEHLDQAASKLREEGVRSVSGGIVYDTSFMEDEKPRYPPNARHLYAPPNALTVNYSWILLRLEDGPPPKLFTEPETAYARLDYDIEVVRSSRPGKPRMTYVAEDQGDAYTIKGTVTDWDKRYKYLRLLVSRPGLYAATLLREALARQGIEVAGKPRPGRAPDAARTLLTLRTPPLREAVRELAQESNNVVAELVNKNLGARLGTPPAGTRAGGLRVLRRVCEQEVGLEPGSFRLADASGLSPQNRLSPRQFTRALRTFYQEVGPELVRALPRQGHHPHAMNPVPPDHIELYVKSGTLPNTGVNATVGVIRLVRTGEALAFAVLVNRKGKGPPAYSGTWTNPLLTSIVDVLKREPSP